MNDPACREFFQKHGRFSTGTYLNAHAMEANEAAWLIT